MRPSFRVLRDLLGIRFRRASAMRAELEQGFLLSERENVLQKFGAASNFVIASVAVISFTLVDYFLTPELHAPFLAARLLVVPFSVACWFAYRLSVFRGRWHTLPAFVSYAYLGALMYYLTSRTGYESSIHYMGLLLAVGTMSSYSWRPRDLFLGIAICCFPFWAGVLTRPGMNLAVVFGDAMIFQGLLVLNLGSFAVARKLRRNDYFRRLRLQNRNRKQKVVIEQKTREGVYLERLASQFSPQVIESIKSGTLDLEARVRRNVACIFVDVQNSTSRIGRIDHHNYTNVLAAFFEDCVKIFLRHNVTVGTYLGDGILAFTNAPTEDPEYRRNALAACVEILTLHERKRQIFFDTWRTEFNIRIGIDSGFATVGFFPSREHGTYTALGETVSLAARLCSRAEVNSVAITKKFLVSAPMPDASLRISRLSTAVDIKGLEGESFEVFSVRPPARESLPKTHCPSCAVPMGRESTQIGASVYCCPGCGFRELLPDQPAPLAMVKKAS